MQAIWWTKVDTSKRIETSRSQLDRVLDSANLFVQLDTLVKAANAVVRTIEIKLKRQSKDRLETTLQRFGCALTLIMNPCTFTN